MFAQVQPRERDNSHALLRVAHPYEDDSHLNDTSLSRCRFSRPLGLISHPLYVYSPLVTTLSSLSSDTTRTTSSLLFRTQASWRSGCWQLRVKGKTYRRQHSLHICGLHECLVIPFGHTNPQAAVTQCPSRLTIWPLTTPSIVMLSSCHR